MTDIQYAILIRKYHLCTEFGPLSWNIPEKVRVMAAAEGYAMVRVNSGVPFVCDVTELEYEASP